MRPSWIEIDLDAIEHNAAEIASQIAPASLCAVVKADAYGHGDIPVAEAAIRGGAAYLAVALVEEGVRLREADIDVPILVLSEPTLDEVGLIVAHGLTPCHRGDDDQVDLVGTHLGGPQAARGRFERQVAGGRSRCSTAVPR